MEKTELIYVEHLAGEFDDGLQICKICGKVLCDYSGYSGIEARFLSTMALAETGKNFPINKSIYISHTDNGGVSFLTYEPKRSYGKNDRFERRIIKCDSEEYKKLNQ